jgi:hypothetical protein
MPRVLKKGQWSGAPTPARRRKIVVRRRRGGAMGGRGVYRFKRTAFYSGLIAGSITQDVSGALIGQLSQVPGYTEFVNMYDEYKITGIKWKFMPRANSAEAGTNQGLIKLFTAIDRNDLNPPTIQDILQYSSLKITPSNRTHTRYIKPTVINFANQTALGSGYMSNRGWLSTDSPTVAHYGLKYLLQQLASGAQSYDLIVEYHLAFRNVK